MCDIWKADAVQEISAEQLDRHAAELQMLGVEWVVFSGGEPLMHSDLFRLARRIRQLGARTTVLSTGLLLEKHAAAIAENIDDVIVSLDGPLEIHNSIRRVPQAFEALAAGVLALGRQNPHLPVAARCTVQKKNAAHLRETIASARRLGLQSISFLAADLTSTAFNRPQGWPADRQAQVGLTAEDLAMLEEQIEAIIREESDGFVLESPEKLRRIVRHFGARLRGDDASAPRCNAPWVSAVIEADGTVRPCFFHPAIGRLGQKSLLDVLNGPAALDFRSHLDVQNDPVCRNCVCSLYRE